MPGIKSIWEEYIELWNHFDILKIYTYFIRRLASLYWIFVVLFIWNSPGKIADFLWEFRYFGIHHKEIRLVFTIQQNEAPKVSTQYGSQQCNLGHESKNITDKQCFKYPPTPWSIMSFEVSLDDINTSSEESALNGNCL